MRCKQKELNESRIRKENVKGTDSATPRKGKIKSMPSSVSVKPGALHCTLQKRRSGP